MTDFLNFLQKDEKLVIYSFSFKMKRFGELEMAPPKCNDLTSFE